MKNYLLLKLKNMLSNHFKPIWFLIIILIGLIFDNKEHTVFISIVIYMTLIYICEYFIEYITARKQK